MKSMNFLLLVIIFTTSMFSFIHKNDYNVHESTCEAEKVKGLYIFVKSKPVKEYEFLGTVKGTFVGSTEFDKMLDGFIKRTLKQYPDADAIIFDGGIRRSDNTSVSAIKFKKDHN